MIRICNTLANEGYKVSLLGRIRKNSPLLPKRKFEQIRFKLPFEKGPLFYLFLNIRFIIYLALKKIDILNACDADTLLTAYFLKLFKKFKLVYDAHEYFTEVPELENREHIKYIWKQIESLGIKKSDAAYTVSERLAKILERDTCFEVIKNVPLIKEKPRQLEFKNRLRNPFILYQGALNTGRGLYQLIDACQKLNIMVKLVGAGDLDTSLRNYVQEKGFSNVEFTGRLKPEELHNLTRKAFLGYNLLEARSKSYYYSLSNKFFDYMQAGLPSLNSDFPEYNAILQKYKCGSCINLETHAIVTEISNYLENESYYLNRCKNSILAAEEFCWEKEKPRLLKIYSKL